jgi:hypothetical protein
MANALAEDGAETPSSPARAAASRTEAYADSCPLGTATRGAKGVGTKARASPPSSSTQMNDRPHVKPSNT